VRKFRMALVLSLFLSCVTITHGRQAPDQPSAVTLAVAPIYPPAAFALPHGGDVRVEVTIRSDGTVADAKPIEGSLLLYDASIKAAKKWHFQASGGERRVVLTFSFRPLASNAPVEDATALFMPPYRLEVRKKTPPSTVNPGY
jgi:TonB family protein